jgi:hypothetical protein
MHHEAHADLSTLRNLQFALPKGRTVPLGQFASPDSEREFPLIFVGKAPVQIAYFVALAFLLGLALRATRIGF